MESPVPFASRPREENPRCSLAEARPTETMNKDDLELRHKANEDLQEILYKGSKEIRNL